MDFWYPLEHVVNFKRGVYTRALQHLAPFAREAAGTAAVPTIRLDTPRNRGRPGAAPGARGRGKPGGLSARPRRSTAD